MKKKIQILTVKAILERDGKILLIKDTKGAWELPGGKIEFGEEPEHTLVRELEEELNIKNCQVERLVNVWTFFVETDGFEKQYFVLVYSCKGGDFANLIESEESMGYKWIAFGDVGGLDMKDGYKRVIKEYFEKIYG